MLLRLLPLVRHVAALPIGALAWLLPRADVVDLTLREGRKE